MYQICHLSQPSWMNLLVLVILIFVITLSLFKFGVRSWHFCWTVSFLCVSTFHFVFGVICGLMLPVLYFLCSAVVQPVLYLAVIAWQECHAFCESKWYWFHTWTSLLWALTNQSFILFKGEKWKQHSLVFLDIRLSWQ